MEEIRFFDEVHDFQRFIRDNIYLLGNLTILSEQLTARNNEVGIMDMLAIDREDNRLVIIELKNEITTDKNVWQPIRYYDLIRRGEDSIKKLLLSASSVIETEIESINLVPKVLLVVPQNNEQLLRTLSYFEEIDIKVIEIKQLKNESSIEITKNIFYPSSIFHKEDLTKIKNKISTNWSFEEYQRKGINKQKIDIAQKTLVQIKNIFTNNNLDFDVFFTETKITITKNSKVWGYIFIKQKPLDYKLTLSFKKDKDKEVNKLDFSYYHHVEDVDIKSNSIKLCINGTLTNELITKCI